MPSQEDVAFGRALLARGAIRQDVLSQVYAQLPPGRGLLEELVAQRFITADQARWLVGQERSRSSSDSGSGSRGGLPEPGDVIDGKYQIVSVLGKGGMGAVYRARDVRGAEVAVKLMLPQADAGGALQRFEREAEAVARVDAHAGIVKVHSAGTHQGMPYAVMDLVEGNDLHEIVKESGPLPLADALTYAEKVARAIQHCHDQGVLHRDLKPANILLRASDKVPFVTDFGLALGDASGERLTKTGEVMGTPAYMSPEQAEGDKTQIDASTDVYALGAVLYELITGRPPFVGDQVQILKRVFMDAPEPVQKHNDTLPAEVDAICQKALAKSKALRYASAGALADDLGRLRRGDPIEARPPTRWEHLRWRLDRKGLTRGRRWALVALVLLMTGGLPAGYAFFRSRDARALLLQGERLPKLADQSLLLYKDDLSLAENLAEGLLLGEARETSISGDELRRLLDATVAARPREDGEPEGLLRSATVDQLDRVERLVWQVALGRGLAGELTSSEPFPEAGEGANEQRLINVLWRLRWNAQVEAGPSTPRGPLEVVEELRALKTTASEKRTRTALREALNQLDAIEGAVKSFREGAQKAILSGGRRPQNGAGLELETKKGAPSLAYLVDPRLRFEKLEAARGVLRGLGERLPGSTDRRWRESGVHYDALLRPIKALSGFLGEAPAVEPDAQTLSEGSKLLTSIVERISAGDPITEVLLTGGADDGLLQLVDALDSLCERGTLAGLHPKLHDLLTSGCIGLLARRAELKVAGDTKDLEAVDAEIVRKMMFFPRLHRLPVAGSMDSVAWAYVPEDGPIARHVEREPSGDAYLVWAKLESEAYLEGDKADPAQLLSMLQHNALALGPELTDEDYASLRVGPRPRRPAGCKPLTPYWRLMAGYELCRLAFQEKLPGDPIPRLRAAALLYRKQVWPELEHATSGLATHYLRRMAEYMLNFWTLLGDAPELAAERERIRGWAMEYLDAGDPLARSWVKRRAGREDTYEGLHDVGQEVDLGWLQIRLIGLANVRADWLKATEGPAAALTPLLSARAFLEGLGLPYNRELGRILAVYYQGAGRTDDAEAEAKRVLEHAEKNPGLDEHDRKDARQDSILARSFLAQLALDRGDRERALELLREAKERGELNDRSWRGLAAALGFR